MEDFLYKFLFFYNLLPQSVKQSIGKVYSFIPKKLKYGHFYPIYRKRIDFFNNLGNIQAIENEQNKLLMDQVNRSIDLIPYYHSYDKIKTLEQFQHLPVIDKNLILKRHTEFINPVLTKKRIKANTGGGSGNPMDFFIEKGISRPKEKAHFDWYWSQYGYNSNDKVLMIRGMPLPNNRLFEYRAIDNVLNVSCYTIHENNIAQVAERINTFKPLFIHAYPSSLKVVVSLLENVKNRIDISIKAIFLGSEHLSGIDRDYFEKFFNTRVANWYGHSERLIHGGNCPYSNEYHFYPSYGYLELLDDENNIITHPGNEGRIVATGFDNKIMPFIRYDTGDLGVLSGMTACKCGFKGISLERIVGRGHDIIVLSDGTRVSLTAFIFGQHLEAFKRIREMQVFQDTIGEIELRIVRNAAFTQKDEESTKRTLMKSVNHKINIRFNYVDSLEKTSRGKNIFFVSRLKK
jgi:phenylacetate-CoA ligase